MHMRCQAPLIVAGRWRKCTQHDLIHCDEQSLKNINPRIYGCWSDVLVLEYKVLKVAGGSYNVIPPGQGQVPTNESNKTDEHDWMLIDCQRDGHRQSPSHKFQELV